MNNNTFSEQAVCFLDVIFDPVARKLQKKGKTLQLRKKEAEVLALLCRLSPAPVTQETFLAEVWGNGYVTSQSIAQIIRALRLYLEDDKKNIIVTIPKLGYQLAVQATSVERDEAIDREVKPDRERVCGQGFSVSMSLTNATVPVPSVDLTVFERSPALAKRKRFPVRRWCLFAIVFLASLTPVDSSVSVAQYAFDDEAEQQEMGKACSASWEANETWPPCGVRPRL